MGEADLSTGLAPLQPNLFALLTCRHSTLTGKYYAERNVSAAFHQNPKTLLGSGCMYMSNIISVHIPFNIHTSVHKLSAGEPECKVNFKFGLREAPKSYALH